MLKPAILAIALIAATPAIGDISISGTLQKWHPITVDNRSSIVLSESQFKPNPFLDLRYNVIFTSPSGAEYTVPGYFAGNGQGSGVGSVWRARFSADEVGEWQYEISFRSGDNISVSLLQDDGEPMPSNGETGTFTVSPQSANAPEFLANGRLQYTGEHYLKHSDGNYWIKGGVDSPENLFGYAGFDNTFDQPEGVRTGSLQDGVHRFEPHIADWQDGDPLFDNSADPNGAKGLIGAINYLSSEAVNSLYFLPMNLGGDGRETYPFIKPTGTAFDNTHYDISKLYQWGIVLNHMQNKGIAAHFVLAETEIGNTNWFDNGELGIERKLYYREMIARYSHLMAVKWNISEESRFTAEQHKSFASYIDQLDWANHAISVHTTQNRPHEQYDDIVGDPLFQASSIQFLPNNSDRFVEEWREKSTVSGWPWVIDMDEVGPATTGLTDTNADELRKSVLYPIYLSGGNIEWYFGYHPLPLGGDMRTENFRTREPMYRYMRYAREMMQAELPFWEMEPDDSLHSAGSTSNVQVFAKKGAIYAVYLPDATDSGSLSVPDDEYQIQWFNPRSGLFNGQTTIIDASDSLALGNAPEDPVEDWVVLVRSTSQLNMQTPDTPDTAETPDNTDNPTTPDDTDSTTTPNNTDTPTTPDNTDSPTTTDTTETPDNTDTPTTTDNSAEDNDNGETTDNSPSANSTEDNPDPAGATPDSGGSFNLAMLILLLITWQWRLRSRHASRKTLI